jgi:hypothetical protein
LAERGSPGVEQHIHYRRGPEREAITPPLVG